MGTCIHSDRSVTKSDIDIVDEHVILNKEPRIDRTEIIQPFLAKHLSEINTSNITDINVELLMSGYSNQFAISNKLRILIQRFYCDESPILLNTYLLSSDYWSLTATHILSKKQYNLDRLDKSEIKDAHNFESKYILNHISLPKAIIENAETSIKPTDDAMITEQLLSNKWSVGISRNPNRYSAAAYHGNLFLNKGNYNASNVLYPITFKLPPLSMDESISFIQLPLVYGYEQNTLFAANIEGHGSSIFGLDFNAIDWEWKSVTMNLLTARYRTSLCMLENDQFMGIFGGVKGYSSNKGWPWQKTAELYSFKHDECITLKDMTWARSNAKSVYNAWNMRVYVTDCHSGMMANNMEWYDVINDKWILMNKAMKIDGLKQIWISNTNPNILFWSRKPNNAQSSEDMQYFELHQIDLRTEISRNVFTTSKGKKNNIIIHL